MFLVCTSLSGNTRFQKTSYSLTNKVLRNSLEKNPETFHQLSSSFQLEGMSTSSTPSKSASLFCLWLPRISLSLSLSLLEGSLTSSFFIFVLTLLQLLAICCREIFVGCCPLSTLMSLLSAMIPFLGFLGCLFSTEEKIGSHQSKQE